MGGNKTRLPAPKSDPSSDSMQPVRSEAVIKTFACFTRDGIRGFLHESRTFLQANHESFLFRAIPEAEVRALPLRNQSWL